MVREDPESDPADLQVLSAHYKDVDFYSGEMGILWRVFKSETESSWLLFLKEIQEGKVGSMETGHNNLSKR